MASEQSVTLESGSSPRGRGTRPALSARSGNHRFIPAWAGNTHHPNYHPEHQAVHPRVGGEHQWVVFVLGDRAGSSPRGRGTRHAEGWQMLASRFIPAWAGNTPPIPVRSPHHSVHPRVGGEHFSLAVITMVAAGSSPRGRGTLCPSTPVPIPRRFIPAWAGNTHPR